VVVEKKTRINQGEWVVGPDLAWDLLIEGRPVQRMGRIMQVYKKGFVLVQATDSPELQPRIFVSESCSDWNHFYGWLSLQWNKSARVPKCFKLLNRLPDTFIQAFAQGTLKDRHQLIKLLLDRQWIDAIPEFKYGAPLFGQRWDVIKKRVYKQVLG
jgi:hypothetical protein